MSYRFILIHFDPLFFFKIISFYNSRRIFHDNTVIRNIFCYNRISSYNTAFTHFYIPNHTRMYAYPCSIPNFKVSSGIVSLHLNRHVYVFVLMAPIRYVYIWPNENIFSYFQF